MQNIKDVIVAVNFKEYRNAKPISLIEMMFDDLIKLLKFVHKARKEGLLTRPFFFTNQIDYLDLIWHQFILHTRLYQDFCEREFGEFLHHDPELVNSVQSVQGFDTAELLAQQIDLLEASLGKEFVNRIFFLYPELLK